METVAALLDPVPRATSLALAAMAFAPNAMAPPPLPPLAVVNAPTAMSFPVMAPDVAVALTPSAMSPPVKALAVLPNATALTPAAVD